MQQLSLQQLQQQQLQQQQQPQSSAAAAGLSAVQAAALLPNKLRPFVAFRPRAYTTQLQRQQVVNKLLGPYLLLLLQELQAPPHNQQKVHNFKPKLLFTHNCCITGQDDNCGHLAVTCLRVCILT